MGIELLAVRLYRQGSHFGGVTVLEGVPGGDKGGKRLVADPWLIATAAVYGYTIVTFEKFVNVNTGNPSGTPKIPNIAEKFHVRTTDLFHMIRDLGVRLKKLASNIDDHSVILNCFLLANGQLIALTTNLVILTLSS
jgi:hypothetical protein